MIGTTQSFEQVLQRARKKRAGRRAFTIISAGDQAASVDLLIQRPHLQTRGGDKA